ncbi:hypothetical protein GQS52_01075 [Streptomyces sp. SCUT-3]|uniref:ATP-grasp domain-containing protein n=1 Tax=Streptomyces TaxID=1883 RepID=UPI0015FE2DAB|nr:ATP-grasp domain-containing protein [Streptomyces sp. SCUT-3]QMV20629.1 hypothetical protein GQS52_01075 [Streptomyces sp. SCUT-3]
MGASFVFCSDPLDPRRVDPHFAREAQAVRASGGRVCLVDHDALLAGDAAGAVARVPRDAGPVRYRGWMVPSAGYAALAGALAARGAALLTSPDAYRRAHELPGWYAVFEAVTPRSVWLPAEPGRAPAPQELAAAVAPLGGGPAVVKDYVKSRKHEWREACWVPELSDTRALSRVVERFVELQEDHLAGGIVVRAFEPFTDGGEARVWWADGEPVLVTAHPDTPGARPDPGPALDALRPLVAALGCPFVTTDTALRADGVWRVVEVGDGQVSGLPGSADPVGLIKPLMQNATGQYSSAHAAWRADFAARTAAR